MLLYFHPIALTQVFFIVLGFSLYFRVDARIFFAVALGGLMVTVLSLMFKMETFAEGASVMVYLALVI
jgi:maltodextrin utilization protein YvdJ